MSETTQTPRPGWYPNPVGQQQWWDDEKWGPLAPAQQHAVVTPKSMGTAYVLLILLGGLGIHRFYLGQTGHGMRFLIPFVIFAMFGFTSGGSSFTDLGMIPSAALLALWIQEFIDLFQLKDAVNAHNATAAQAAHTR